MYTHDTGTCTTLPVFMLLGWVQQTEIIQNSRSQELQPLLLVKCYLGEFTLNMLKLDYTQITTGTCATVMYTMYSDVTGRHL